MLAVPSAAVVVVVLVAVLALSTVFVEGVGPGIGRNQFRTNLKKVAGRGQESTAKNPFHVELGDDEFWQPISQRTYFSDKVPSQQRAPWNVLNIPSSVRQIIPCSELLNDQSLFWIITDSSWQLLNAQDMSVSRLDESFGVRVVPFTRLYVDSKGSKGSLKVYVASPDSFTSLSCTSASTCLIVDHFDSGVSFGRVSAIVHSNNGTVWVGSDTGLHFFHYTVEKKPTDNGKSAAPAIYTAGFVEVPVNDMTYDEKTDNLVVANDDRVWQLIHSAKWVFTWRYGLIDDIPTSVHFAQNGDMWVGNDVCVNILRSNNMWQRKGGWDGLPYSNVTALYHGYVLSSESMWVGTLRGLALYEKEDQQWRFYSGDRWLAGEAVSAIASTVTSLQEELVVVATDVGISIIRFEKWNFQQKADYFEEVLDARHRRFNIVVGSSLSSYGDLSTSTLGPTDNDGLWTSIYLAAESFRYAVTRDPDAKRRAWETFLAMEMLMNVTGVDGLIARCYQKGPAPADPDWHDSTSIPGWSWKGDASSDEVVGHMFGYPLFHDLVAETPEEKSRAIHLIRSLIGGIVENNFTLIDVTGKPTKWGHWDPASINDGAFWYDERGTNSLQILSYLVAAERLTGEPRFSDAYNLLAYGNGYLDNVLNLKITIPDDVNYSDDELTFLPYYTLYHSHGFKDEFWMSMNRTFDFIQRERLCLWDAMYIACSKNSDPSSYADIIEDIKFDLTRWPVDLISWPWDVSYRKDAILDPSVGRGGDHQAFSVFPVFRGVFPRDETYGGPQWNSNPFSSSDGSGRSEESPAPWLLAYWISKYHKLV